MSDPNLPLSLPRWQGIPGNVLVEPYADTHQVKIEPAVAAPALLVDEGYCDVRLVYEGPAVPPMTVDARIAAYTFYLPGLPSLTIPVNQWTRIPTKQAVVTRIRPEYHRWEKRELVKETFLKP